MALTGFLMLFAWLAAIAGGGLLVLSLTVRRHGFDGHCRRCEYNVSRTPADVFRCPECGSDLNQPRAIVLGRRRNLASHARLGGTLFGVGAPIVAASLWLEFSGRDINTFKPYWVLLTEAESGFVETELSALEELQKRASAKLLSESRLAELATIALKRGRERPRRVEQAWRQLYLSGVQVGNVQEQTLRAFLADSLRPIVEFRETYRLGDPLPFTVRYVVDGLTLDHFLTFQEVTARIKVGQRTIEQSMTLNSSGKPVRPLALESMLTGVESRSIDRAYCFDLQEVLDELEPGPQVVEGTIVIQAMPSTISDGVAVELPWKGEINVADRSAAGMKSVSPWELWPESEAKPQVRVGLVTTRPRVVTRRDESVGYSVLIPQPAIDEIIPVRVMLRTMTREIDCGVIVLNGESSDFPFHVATVASKLDLRLQRGDSVRVIVAPADDVADRFLAATRTLAAGRSWTVEVMNYMAPRAQPANRPATQPARVR